MLKKINTVHHVSMYEFLENVGPFDDNETILYPLGGGGDMMKIWNKNTGPDFKQK